MKIFYDTVELRFGGETVVSYTIEEAKGIPILDTFVEAVLHRRARIAVSVLTT